MWPTEDDLENLDAIIDRMNPIFGFPYPMKVAKNVDFPKDVGDPWIGAYTKNGYWYRFSWGDKQEWNEIVEDMWYRNQFLLDRESFEFATKLFGDGNVQLLTAKNIRCEVLGTALIAKSNNFSLIGALFVNEDFRHVGIGSKIMKEIVSTDTVINCISYLLPTISRFGLEKKLCRRFFKYIVTNSSGFSDLMDTPLDLQVKSELNEEEWKKVSEYCFEITSEMRNWDAFGSIPNKYHFFSAFKEEKCVGICVLREVHNSESGGIPDLIIGPLYAEKSEIAEILLKTTLKLFYNPEDDYDFDIDILAIYRRSINFFIFEQSENNIITIVEKLKGSQGTLEKHRLFYQTCSNFPLPAIESAQIFCTSDPHVHIV